MTILCKLIVRRLLEKKDDDKEELQKMINDTIQVLILF